MEGTTEMLITSLFKKCFDNKLDFEYHEAPAIVSVFTFKNEAFIKISNGYIKKWKFETPEEVLTRMHKEVDEYLEGK